MYTVQVWEGDEERPWATPTDLVFFVGDLHFEKAIETANELAQEYGPHCEIRVIDHSDLGCVDKRRGWCPVEPPEPFPGYDEGELRAEAFARGGMTAVNDLYGGAEPYDPAIHDSDWDRYQDCLADFGAEVAAGEMTSDEAVSICRA